MAKTLKEVPLTTRSARAKLPIGLHWRGIDPETHLGYRKGVRGGVWLVRWRVGTGYRQDRLGTADDELSEGTLDYITAIRAARTELRERVCMTGQHPRVRSRPCERQSCRIARSVTLVSARVAWATLVERRQRPAWNDM